MQPPWLQHNKFLESGPHRFRHFFDTNKSQKRKSPVKTGPYRVVSGAGEGNRTLVMSLGSSGNAIIRRPLRDAFLPEALGEMKGVGGFFW